MAHPTEAQDDPGLRLLPRLTKLSLFALVLHFFVLPQIGGARRALSVVSSVNPWLIGAAVVLEGLALLAYARLTQQLIPEDNRPGLGVTYGAVVASTGVNHVVPGGAATTAAVNSRLLNRAGVPGADLGFALGTQAIGSAVVLNLLLLGALIVSIPVSGFQPIYASAAVVGVVLITAFAVGVVTMLRGRHTFADRVARVAGRLPRLDEDQVRSTMLDLAEQLELLARDRHRLRVVISLAAANWLLDAAALWVGVTAFGPAPRIDGLLVAYGLANVMAVIPLSPGGLGVIEAILIPTLVGFGTPRAQASIGVVAYRLVNFWLPIPLGAAAYIGVERATRSGPAESRGEDRSPSNDSPMTRDE